jgi:hypothetical protein
MDIYYLLTLYFRKDGDGEVSMEILPASIRDLLYLHLSEHNRGGFRLWKLFSQVSYNQGMKFASLRHSYRAF